MFELHHEVERPDFVVDKKDLPNIEQYISKDYKQKLKYASKIELDRMRELYPCRFFIPNVGQEKAVEPYKHHNGTELGVPFVNVFGGGNGVGKTTMLVNFCIGLCFGVEELNEFFEDYYVFDRMVTRRVDLQRPTSIRIVCNGDSMKENGALYTEIMKWFPTGRFRISKNGKGFYSQIKCYAEDGETILANIDVKSHEQSIVAMSGSNLDAILFDEPPPELLYGECVGRLRGGGFMCFFLTPLEMSSFLYKQVIEDCDGVTKVCTNASIWDNCADIAGKRGHLKKEMIDQLISEWKRINPLEVEARVNGTFQHLSGAIFKIWTDSAHLLPQFKVPDEYVLHFGIDPHDARYPSCVWVAQSPTSCFVVAEWPTEDYTKLSTSTLTISDYCDAIRQVEAGLGRKADFRFCDPNVINKSYPNSRLTLAQEFDRFGIELEGSDDNIEVGFSRLQELLYYDVSSELSAFNVPKLRVFDHCRNTRDALKNFGFRKNANHGSKNFNSKVDQTYKDFVDCLRYVVIAMGPYVPPDQQGKAFVDSLFGGR